MKRLAYKASLLCMSAMLSGTASGHHGVASYDVAEIVTLAGTVSEWRWSSPHTWLYLDVSGPDGGVERWSIEGGPPRPMEQQGWSSASLRAGERVTIEMSPARREQRSGILRRVTRDAGEVLVIHRPWIDN